jgi:hypothetical protein
VWRWGVRRRGRFVGSLDLEEMEMEMGRGWEENIG